MEFADLERLITALNGARSFEDLDEALARASERLGFAHYALMHHAELRTARRPLLRLSNYPTAWQERYLERAYFFDDPTFVACRARATSFALSEVPGLVELTPRQKEMLDEAARFGMRDGLFVPIHIPGEISGSCSLVAARDVDIPRAIKPLAHYVRCFAFEAGRRILQTGPSVAVALTRRQLDCVALVARGKSDWEAARILGISEATVHQHIQAAKARYGVATRIQLVVRAILDNSLSIADVA
jgi:LuxR family quorum-sensing system transcriptional regulator CciR